MHREDIDKILFTEDQIRERVKELGKKIATDYAGKELVVVGLLKGAAWFLADLTRAIDMPLKVDFMVVSSYGNNTISSGSIDIRLNIREDLHGKNVLLVDDIIDTGLTFSVIADMLKKAGAVDVKTCVLCDKKGRRSVDFNCDYVGFEIPDEFVVGNGFDYAQDYRNLPFIGVLKSSVYTRAK